MKIKEIKDNEKLEKRKRVIATIATIAIGSMLFAFNAKESKENNKYVFEETSKDTRFNVLEDMYGNWTDYDDVVNVIFDNGREKEVLLMGKVKEEINGQEKKTTYNSITHPEIYLEYTYEYLPEEESCKEIYELKTMGFQTEEAREKFISEHPVLSVAHVIGLKEKSFKDIASQENFQNKYINGKSLVELPKLLSETEDTLFVYNSYLEKMGSNKRLTADDLRLICENSHMNIMSIKLKNNDYSQVGNDYTFSVNEYGELELVLENALNRYDQLTKTRTLKNNYKIVAKFDDFIGENGVEPLGYTRQIAPGWDDHSAAFVRENYGEDVLNCLQEKGFPLVCFSAQALYDAYYESLFKIDGLSR